MHFNPHLPRGRRQAKEPILKLICKISTHTSLAGGDGICRKQCRQRNQFQPTPPSREATQNAYLPNVSFAFQPTPPSLEATTPVSITTLPLADFNPHLPRGRRRHTAPFHQVYCPDFNPHLPRGRRPVLDHELLHQFQFQPTPPSREATDSPLDHEDPAYLFQPTPPSREATTVNQTTDTDSTISTHTSLAGGDCNYTPMRVDIIKFQPTPPSREATVHGQPGHAGLHISTHTSLAGGDADRLDGGTLQHDFNPHLPRGRRQLRFCRINSTS